ncbi:hypothetical protein CRUP_007197 [Coryphaenoides rupestris]|nr:hypothetical protein CRUP_007197 [Coryphaenoides rupestris]
MANVVVFQSKLSSVMDMLAKAAIVEISRLWDDAFAFVQLEVRQREHEIESLKSKVLMMEKERLELLSKTAPSAQPSAPSLSTTRQPNNVLRKAPVNDGPIIVMIQTKQSLPNVRETADTLESISQTPAATQREHRTLDCHGSGHRGDDKELSVAQLKEESIELGVAELKEEDVDDAVQMGDPPYDVEHDAADCGPNHTATEVDPQAAAAAADGGALEDKDSGRNPAQSQNG